MKKKTIGTFAAKTHLSHLLDQVSRGRSFLITRRGRPVAELRPVALDGQSPTFGCDAGRLTIREDFDAPLDDMRDYMR